MSIVKNDVAETQAAKVLHVQTNDSGQLEFEIVLTVGDWTSRRKITVTDRSIDVNDLLRRITARDTGVTEVGRPEGQIIYGEPSGRRYIVAEWTTLESKWNHDMEGEFVFPVGDEEKEKQVKVAMKDIENVQIELEFCENDQDEDDDLDDERPLLISEALLEMISQQRQYGKVINRSPILDKLNAVLSGSLRPRRRTTGGAASIVTTS